MLPVSVCVSVEQLRHGYHGSPRRLHLLTAAVRRSACLQLSHRYFPVHHRLTSPAQVSAYPQSLLLLLLCFCPCLSFCFTVSLRFSCKLSVGHCSLPWARLLQQPVNVPDHFNFSSCYPLLFTLYLFQTAPHHAIRPHLAQTPLVKSWCGALPLRNGTCVLLLDRQLSHTPHRHARARSCPAPSCKPCSKSGPNTTLDLGQRPSVHVESCPRSLSPRPREASSDRGISRYCDTTAR